MSYVYSKSLCHEALRWLSSDNAFESRLAKAFSEMGVSRKGDTSDEIWKKWKELQKKYHSVSNEIYNQGNGFVSEELEKELKECGQSLVALICDWMEFNSVQISKGKRK